jgi:hypothetical protein
MATTWIKPLHRSNNISSALGNSLDYIKNKSKTNAGELVEGYMCQAQTAQNEFLLSKQIYVKNTGRDQGKNNVIAYHIRMSFKPGEVTAEKALALGWNLAMRWTRGKHQFVIAAHINTNNPHIHIIYNSVTLDCDRKYKDLLHSYKALRRLSDMICLEHGLAIIENPKLSKGYNRAEYLHARDGGEDDSTKPLTVRDQLRGLIDGALKKTMIDHGVIVDGKVIKTISRDDTEIAFDGFIAVMKSIGCEVKHRKHLAFKIPGGQRFIRCKSLGEDYTESALLERLSGERILASVTPVDELSSSCDYSVPEQVSQEVLPQPMGEDVTDIPRPFAQSTSHNISSQLPSSQPTISPSAHSIEKPNLLINIQAKLQQAHSPGFEHYARRYNLKEMAKTLIFLKERGLLHYDTLVEKSDAVSLSFRKRCSRIKAIEARQKKISDLQKNISTYIKTKDVFAEYNKLKNVKPSAFVKFTNAKTLAQKFYEENEASILRCRAAKKYFDEQGFGNATGKKLPTIKLLQTEYATLEAERKRLWSGHRAERDEMVALKMAKQNCDIFLGELREPQKAKSHEHDL